MTLTFTSPYAKKGNVNDISWWMSEAEEVFSEAGVQRRPPLCPAIKKDKKYTEEHSVSIFPDISFMLLRLQRFSGFK